MKIAILGTGGVGGYFGGLLAKAGNDVTFFARGTHLQAMLQNGLKVKSVLGDFDVPKVKATDDIHKIGKCDLVIIAVKAWQVSDMAAILHPLMGAETLVLPLQNGVMAVDDLKQHIAEKNLLNGLCKIFSKIEAPGVIHHFGINPSLLFGELNNTKTDRVLRLKAVFDAAGINAGIPIDIWAESWKKFIPICVGGLLAISKTNYGELREIKETRQLMIDLLEEVYGLSQKIGIQIEPGFVEASVALIDTYPYETTTSLARDVVEGKPSELEYQNGSVVRLGEKYGFHTPLNRFIYSCLLPMEHKAQKRS